MDQTNIAQYSSMPRRNSFSWVVFILSPGGSPRVFSVHILAHVSFHIRPEDVNEFLFGNGAVAGPRRLLLRLQTHYSLLLLALAITLTRNARFGSKLLFVHRALKSIIQYYILTACQSSKFASQNLACHGFRVYHNPWYGFAINPVTESMGCISQCIIKVWGDRRIFRYAKWKLRG